MCKLRPDGEVASFFALNHSVLLYSTISQQLQQQVLKLLFNTRLSCYYKDFITNVIRDINQYMVDNGSAISTLVLTENVLAFATIHRSKEQRTSDSCTTDNEVVETIHFIHLLQISKIESTLNVGLRVSKIAAAESRVLFSTRDGRAYSLGEGKYGELGLGPSITETMQPQEISRLNGEFVKEISTGNHHSCLITDPHGFLYTFGSTAYGRLGLGSDSTSLLDTTDCIFFPQLVEGLVGIGQLLPNGQTTGVGLVACGQWHTVVVAAGTNDVYGWGWNKFGQLGMMSGQELIDEPERLSVLDDESLLGDDITGLNRVIRVWCGSTFTTLITANNRLITM